MLLACNHDCIHWEIGEHGDALGHAIISRNTELVRFLSDEGSDVQNSLLFGTPVPLAAKELGAAREIIHLLESHGAPE